jgi:hypothetical protein
MKRLASSVAVVMSLLIITGIGFAQANPAMGTWKLNLDKSKLTSMPSPKSMTRTAESAGDAMKVTYAGEASDGTPIAFTFTVSYDGKYYPVTGSGQPFGADSIAVKRLSPQTVESTLKKGDAVVAKAETTLSGDATMLTVNYEDVKGKPTGNTFVYTKQ